MERKRQSAEMQSSYIRQSLEIKMDGRHNITIHILLQNTVGPEFFCLPFESIFPEHFFLKFCWTIFPNLYGVFFQMFRIFADSSSEIK